MQNLTENPAVIYTAMYGMRPQRGRVSPPDAFRAIGSSVASGLPVQRFAIKTQDSLTALTVVSVATMDGRVTGVYEIYGDSQ